MTTVNQAKFTIDGDTITDDRGYDATNSQTLDLTLDVNPSPALSVLYEVYSAADGSSPYSSKGAPDLTFVDSGTYQQNIDNPNGTAQIIMPSSGSHSYVLRCTASTPAGAHVYDRLVVIRETSTSPNLRKTVPTETSEYLQRGWSDSFNDLVDAIANGGGAGSGPGGSASEVQYRIDATTFGGASAASWDNSNSALVLGVASSAPFSSTTVPLYVTGENSSKQINVLVAGNSNTECGYLIFVRGDGTSYSSPSAVTANSVLGYVLFGGTTDNTWTNRESSGAQIYGQATENWSGSQQGTRLRFNTIRNGTTTAHPRWAIEGDGTHEFYYNETTWPGNIGFSIPYGKIGCLIGADTADPSSPSDGHIYYNSTSDVLRLRANGAWVNLATSSADYWSRTGTTLSPITSGDDVNIDGGITVTGGAVDLTTASGTDATIATTGVADINLTATNDINLTAIDDIHLNYDTSGSGGASVRIQHNGTDIATFLDAGSIHFNPLSGQNLEATTLGVGDIVLSSADAFTSVYNSALGTGDYKIQWGSVPTDVVVLSQTGSVTITPVPGQTFTVTTGSGGDVVFSSADNISMSVTDNLTMTTGEDMTLTYDGDDSAGNNFKIVRDTGGDTLLDMTHDGEITLSPPSGIACNVSLEGSGASFVVVNSTVEGIAYLGSSIPFAYDQDLFSIDFVGNDFTDSSLISYGRIQVGSSSGRATMEDGIMTFSVASNEVMTDVMTVEYGGVTVLSLESTGGVTVGSVASILGSITFTPSTNLDFTVTTDGAGDLLLEDGDYSDTYLKIDGGTQYVTASSDTQLNLSATTLNRMFCKADIDVIYDGDDSTGDFRLIRDNDATGDILLTCDHAGDISWTPSGKYWITTTGASDLGLYSDDDITIDYDRDDSSGDLYIKRDGTTLMSFLHSGNVAFDLPGNSQFLDINNAIWNMGSADLTATTGTTIVVSEASGFEDYEGVLYLFITSTGTGVEDMAIVSFKIATSGSYTTILNDLSGNGVFTNSKGTATSINVYVEDVGTTTYYDLVVQNTRSSTAEILWRYEIRAV